MKVCFQTIDVQTFLQEYWQKKPLVIRQALPDCVNPLSPDELAGLALEETVESRLVFETPESRPAWHLKRGPFVESDFVALPKTHWTLLVQGVDRIVPDVMQMLDAFEFIPQWRVDDVMVSYAPQHGSVGPHYDNYDVFLYQAEGRRQWSLTTKGCHAGNSVPDLDLRIMASFEVEETYLLEPGDMLYLPPHVGHHGVSLSDDCMTYSFGYRSYQAQELWDGFGDFLSEQAVATRLYPDPDWTTLHATSDIPPDAWRNARDLMAHFLNDDAIMKRWFGCFVTRLDAAAEQDMALPLTEDEMGERADFIQALLSSKGVIRDASCRMAYQDEGAQLFVNGCEWDTTGVSPALVRCVANHRQVPLEALRPFLALEDDQIFLYELWRLQWVVLSG